jgi:uncharacterized protein (DUF1800 family)
MELAGQLRSDGLHIGRGVETILRSELFFSERNLHAQVGNPAGFVVGTVRALERFNRPPSTLLLAEWTGRMGEALFFPPNVGGWPGGRSWLSGRAVGIRVQNPAFQRLTGFWRRRQPGLRAPTRATTNSSRIALSTKAIVFDSFLSKR